MPEIIEDYLTENASTLRKIVGGNGNTPGTFCVAKGRKVGLAIFLQKKDKSGSKVKEASKVFKGKSANKFAIGTVNVEEGKLVFRVMRGTLPAKSAQKTLRTDFNDAPSPIPALLRKSISSKGAAPIAAEDKVIDGEQIEALDVSKYQQESLQEIQDDPRLSEKEKRKRKRDIEELWDTEESTVGMNVVLSTVYDQLIDDDAEFDDHDIEELSQLGNVGSLDSSVLEPALGQDMGVISSACRLMATVENNRARLNESREQYKPTLTRTITAFETAYNQQASVFEGYLNGKSDKNYHKIAAHVRNTLLTPHITALNTAARNVTDHTAVAAIQKLDANIGKFIDFLTQNYKIKTIDQCISGSDLGDGLVVKLQDIQEHLQTYTSLS